MKKLIPILLIALLLTACTAAPQGNPDLQITRATESSDEVETTTEAIQEETGVFSFKAGDATLVPGALFDATKVSYDDVYEVPSCAGDGTDKVYITAYYEITAYHDGKNEIVYSVAFLTPNVQTDEGLALGDDLAKAATLYGEYEESGNAWIFTRGDTQLWVIGENNAVISIELRWANA